jgi:hypothetical protein
MKYFTKTSFTIIICFLVVLLSACKKKEIQGPKGDPGTPGGGGNSNITSTSVFTITSSQWVADTAGDCLKVTLNFTSLTKDVVDNGGVKVFFQQGTTWSELPFTSGDLFTQFGFDEGHLYLKYINIEGGIPSAPPDAGYRMVILSQVN